MMASLKSKIYFSPLFYLIHFATLLLGKLGKRCIVYGYRYKGKWLRRTRIASTVLFMEKEKMEIGDNVWINHYTWVDASGGLKIGEGCQIGFSCAILTHSSHISCRLMGKDYMLYTPKTRKGYIHAPVEIGDYTFVGSGSYILPGVKIGKGCVIGVNSVVNRDVPDHTVVAGSPARVIGNTKDQDASFLNDPEVMKTYYERQD